MSLGVYVPVAITVPVVVGVNDTLQLATVVLTVANVHGAPENVPEDVPPLVKPTVPAGDDAVPAAVSLTNAVHDVACPTMIDVGEQVTVVLVDRSPEMVTVLLVPLLVE